MLLVVTYEFVNLLTRAAMHKVKSRMDCGRFIWSASINSYVINEAFFLIEISLKVSALYKNVNNLSETGMPLYWGCIF